MKDGIVCHRWNVNFVPQYNMRWINDERVSKQVFILELVSFFGKFYFDRCNTTAITDTRQMFGLIFSKLRLAIENHACFCRGFPVFCLVHGSETVTAFFLHRRRGTNSFVRTRSLGVFSTRVYGRGEGSTFGALDRLDR